MFTPNFRITGAITQALMQIEADRQTIAGLPLDVEMLASLRETARLTATHYSTQIEGNRLTQTQVQEALAGARLSPCAPPSVTRQQFTYQFETGRLQ